MKNLPAMGELRKMQILDANHNDIEKLPDFYGCTALKEIYIANNFIKVLAVYTQIFKAFNHISDWYAFNVE